MVAVNALPMKQSSLPCQAVMHPTDCDLPRNTHLVVANDPHCNGLKTDDVVQQHCDNAMESKT